VKRRPPVKRVISVCTLKGCHQSFPLAPLHGADDHRLPFPVVCGPPATSSRPFGLRRLALPYGRASDTAYSFQCTVVQCFGSNRRLSSAGLARISEYSSSVAVLPSTKKITSGDIQPPPNF
jgi:hypothetical protein